MKIFVTGATGVVGRRLVPLLASAGHEVTAAVRSLERSRAVEAGGARALPIDLFESQALRIALEGHDAVVNLATHMPRLDWHVLAPGAWRENDRLRRVASNVLVDAAIAAGIPRFIQESFAPAYPDCADRWITEDTPLAPGRYNRSLGDCERAAARFTAQGGTGIVLRFGAFYGPDAEQLRNLIGAIRKGWGPLPGRPEGYLSSISHDDAASATAAALAAPAGIYNVVDDEPMRRREYLDALARALVLPPPRMPPYWTRHLMGSVGRVLARSQRVSNRKLCRCGWSPRDRSAREGLRRAVAEVESATAG